MTPSLLLLWVDSASFLYNEVDVCTLSWCLPEGLYSAIRFLKFIQSLLMASDTLMHTSERPEMRSASVSNQRGIMAPSTWQPCCLLLSAEGWWLIVLCGVVITPSGSDGSRRFTTANYAKTCVCLYSLSWSWSGGFLILGWACLSLCGGGLFGMETFSFLPFLL